MVMEVGVSDTVTIGLEMIYRMAYTKTKRPERGVLSESLAETQAAIISSNKIQPGTTHYDNKLILHNLTEISFQRRPRRTNHIQE